MSSIRSNSLDTQSNMFPSFIKMTAAPTRKSAYKRCGVMKEPQGDLLTFDPSIVYTRHTSDRRAISEGPNSGAQLKKRSLVNMFLPDNNSTPRVIIKKYSKDLSRKSSFDSGIEIPDDELSKRKKSMVKIIPMDKEEQLKMTCELVQQLKKIKEKMVDLQKDSEEVLQRQRNSADFQIQVMKKSDAPDLEIGVNKVLEMVDFDRKQELARLLKKSDDIRKRMAHGTRLDGDDEELRDLVMATTELEKKTIKGFEEVARLQVKTENVVVRQREQEQIQRKKREKIAMTNGTMMVLLNDAKVIDSLLVEVREFQVVDQKEGEQNIEEFFTLMGDDCMEQIRDDIEKVEEFKNTTEGLKEGVWEDRLESNLIQTAVVDMNTSINVVEAAELLRAKIRTKRQKMVKVKEQYGEFMVEQKRRYDVILKGKREEAERLRLKKIQEEEEMRRREEEERERLKMLRLAEEEEQKKREDEEKRRLEEEILRKQQEEEDRIRKEEERRLLAERMRLKHDIQTLLTKEVKNLQEIQTNLTEVEDIITEVEKVVSKRIDVCIDPSKMEDNIIDKMNKNWTSISQNVEKDEEETVRLGRLLVEPEQDLNDLLDKTKKLVINVEKGSKRTECLRREVKDQFDKQQHKLEEQLMEIARREEEARDAARKAQAEMDAAAAEAERLRLLALEQLRLLEEQERLRRIREEEEAARFNDEERKRRLLEDEERLRIQREEEERLRRQREEEEEARRRQRELEDLEASMRAQQNEIENLKEEWRDFDWDEIPDDSGEWAGELLGCLANPVFFYGIRDPRKIKEILDRARRMKEIREKMKAEAIKMAEIVLAIEKMVERARLEEEKRWARQNTEWIKDDPVFNPADMICSTHMASFAPVCTITLEQSRQLVTERKISREAQKVPVGDSNRAPETMNELARMNSDYDTDLLEGGYGNWSRKRLTEKDKLKSRSSRSRFL